MGNKAKLFLGKKRKRHNAETLAKARAIRNQRHPIRENIKADETETQSDQEPEVWDPGNVDQDSLDLFFASVCQSTKRLPKKYQGMIKRQVLDVLLRVEDEYDNEHDENKDGVTKNFD
ncbi:hypothetical protein O3G_MSEX006954 [Manduca sexta]|uniref:BESS domain-containing protein n=1 Tax=Manduca sexta TaxID=7130 RepID=A0A921Z6L5_MANSE|nr:hypothetical protein O3G_MSEX006954 [Manduca sexta]